MQHEETNRLDTPSGEVPTDPIRVVLIEDNPGDAELLQGMLRCSTLLSFDAHWARTLAEGTALLGADPRDVVVLDLSLPDSQGLHSLEQLHASFEGVPIVVMTGNEDEALALRTLRGGADGFLVKGEVSAGLLVRTLWHAIKRRRLAQSLGQSREREHRLATHDTLTGLPNRVLFADRLSQAITIAGRSDENVAVLVGDIDRLRRINDHFGQSVGDDLLSRIATRMRSCLRATETLARIGGDEFGIVLTGVGREVDAARVAERVLGVLATPIPIRGQPCVLTASVGIALFPVDGTHPESLTSNAELALYHAKRWGGNRYEFYRPELNAQASERLDLENEFRIGLDRGDLVAHFQPKIDAETMRCAGVEALVRWQHPERGLIPPGKFIPIAEEVGLIGILGDWVLREACRQGKVWKDLGLPALPVAVNVSARQFEDDGFPSRVLSVLSESELDPALLELEVTESTLMQDLGKVSAAMQELKETGVRFAIDDFGTGYSSLAVLRSLPVDCLKIDRCFVRRLPDDEREARLAEAIVTLAHGLGLETVAEGVETPEQAEFLVSIGCRYLQGFLFSQPLPADDLDPLLRAPAVSWKEA